MASRGYKQADKNMTGIWAALAGPTSLSWTEEMWRDSYLSAMSVLTGNMAPERYLEHIGKPSATTNFRGKYTQNEVTSNVSCGR